MARVSNLDDVVAALERGAQPHVPVRTLLGWFDAQRRGSRVIDSIGRELEARRLITEPSYEHAHIDEQIAFRLLLPEPAGSSKTPTAPPKKETDPGRPEHHPHAQRVRSVPSARRAVETVPPDTPVSRALSILLGRRIAQLAVISGTRQLRGMFSWHSYGAALTLGRTPQTVQEAMEPARPVALDADLFQVARDVAAHGAVIVLEKDHTVRGIVTAADLARYMADLAEPFALVGEVEGYLRTLRRRVDPEKDDGADETLAEQHRWFAENWPSLTLAFDREYFLAELDEVRQIRNDIAHFSPDPLDHDRLRRLRDFARLLARLTDG